MKEVRTYTYTVLLDHNEAGGFVASCLALPSVVAEGETVEEAVAMARDAIQGYLTSLQKDGLPVPIEQGSTLFPVKIDLP